MITPGYSEDHLTKNLNDENDETRISIELISNTRMPANSMEDIAPYVLLFDEPHNKKVTLMLNEGINSWDTDPNNFSLLDSEDIDKINHLFKIDKNSLMVAKGGECFTIYSLVTGKLQKTIKCEKDSCDCDSDVFIYDGEFLVFSNYLNSNISIVDLEKSEEKLLFPKLTFSLGSITSLVFQKSLVYPYSFWVKLDGGSIKLVDYKNKLVTKSIEINKSIFFHHIVSVLDSKNREFVFLFDKNEFRTYNTSGGGFSCNMSIRDAEKKMFVNYTDDGECIDWVYRRCHVISNEYLIQSDTQGGILISRIVECPEKGLKLERIVKTFVPFKDLREFGKDYVSVETVCSDINPIGSSTFASLICSNGLLEFYVLHFRINGLDFSLKQALVDMFERVEFLLSCLDDENSESSVIPKENKIRMEIGKISAFSVFAILL